MKPPSFPFYVNNWLASERVSAMKPEQEGAYIRLLAFAWNSADCGLPDDPDILASLSRLNGRWPDLSATILKCFHKKDGRLYNEKLLDCWRRAQEFSEKQRMKGKASGQARRQPETNRGSTVVQPVLNSESESEFESDSETEIEREVTTRTGEYAPHVLKILRCRPEFRQLIPENVAQEIIRATSSPTWEKNLAEFLADAANLTQPWDNPLSMLRKYLNHTTGHRGSSYGPQKPPTRVLTLVEQVCKGENSNMVQYADELSRAKNESQALDITGRAGRAMVPADIVRLVKYAEMIKRLRKEGAAA